MRGCSCRGTAGFAHVSCLAEQAKILYAEAEENNLDNKVLNARWTRWQTCGLCEQHYHGVVRCALGWACWKTYVGRPETDQLRGMAMEALGNGLLDAQHYVDALSVYEAELSTVRRIGAFDDSDILVVQSNLARTYALLGQDEQAADMFRDVYLGHLKLYGEEHRGTVSSASNYAALLISLQRFREAKSLLRKTIPVTRSVLGESSEITLKMMRTYARALYEDPGATHDDIREAVTTLEDTEQIARRVLGGGHPTVASIVHRLRRAVLRLGSLNASGRT